MPVDPGLLYVIAASLPIVSGLLLFLLRKRNAWRGWIAFGSIGLSATMSLAGAVLFYQNVLSAREQMQPVLPWTGSFTWLHLSFLGYEGIGNLGFSVDAPGVELRLGYHVDGLAVILFLLVTTVAFCISLYSVKAVTPSGTGMNGSAGLCLFTGLLLHLMLADNLLQVFLVWELIGLAIYFSLAAEQDPSTGKASPTRVLIYHLVGDVGFLLAMAIFWLFTGTLSLVTVREEVRTVLGNVVLEDGLPKRRIDQLSIADALRTPNKDTHDDSFNEAGAEAGQWCRVEFVKTARGRKKLELSETGSHIVVWNQETLNGHYHKPDRRRFDAFDPSRDNAHGKGLRTMPYSALLLAGMGLLLAALAKSAQCPLSTWLPEALAVSTRNGATFCLVATLSGVYLLARAFPLLANEVLLTASYLGILTAFYGVTCALAQRGVKGWLAWSTVSQVGLSLAALGVGGWAMALFHLSIVVCCITLLFLGAGGQRRITPVTAGLMFLACASLVGLPLLPGSQGRDGILAALLSNCSLNPVHSLLPVLAGVTIVMTVISMSRFWWLLLPGIQHDDKLSKSPGEPNRWQRLAMGALAGMILLIAWFPFPLAMNRNWLLRAFRFSEPESVHADRISQFTGAMEQLENGYFKSESWLRPVYERFSIGPDGLAMVLSVTAILLGAAIAWKLFRRHSTVPDAEQSRFFKSGWYLNEVLTLIFAKPVFLAGKVLVSFDTRFWDGMTHGLVSLTLLLARGVKRCDDYLFDGLPRQLGAWARSLVSRQRKSTLRS